jgi:transcriptional regulator with XRE-family HTH domain
MLLTGPLQSLTIVGTMANPLARRISELLALRRMTQRGLDRAADLGNGYTNLLLSGKRTPKRRTLANIARALDVPLAELESLMDDAPDDSQHAGDDQAKDVNPTLATIQAHTLAIGRLDPDALESLVPILEAMKEKAERDYEEELRVRRAERKRAKESGRSGKKAQPASSEG